MLFKICPRSEIDICMYLFHKKHNNESTHTLTRFHLRYLYGLLLEGSVKCIGIHVHISSFIIQGKYVNTVMHLMKLKKKGFKVKIYGLGCWVTGTFISILSINMLGSGTQKLFCTQ